MIKHLINFSVDKEKRKVNVERIFAATLARVWRAWTESQILDQWWAPKPWRAETQRMNFNPGGFWRYAMIGTDGERHWSRADFESVDTPNSFTCRVAFSDEAGNVNYELPISFWNVQFAQYGESTLVSINIDYDKLSDLETTVEMGFQEGFTAAMENLDDFLENQLLSSK